MNPLDLVQQIVGQTCEFLGIAEFGVSKPDDDTVEVGFTTVEDADAFLALFTPWPAFLMNGEPKWQRVDRIPGATPAVVGLRIPDGDMGRVLVRTSAQQYGPGMLDRFLVEQGELDPADVRHVHPWVDEDRL